MVGMQAVTLPRIVTEDDVRARAYVLWDADGRPEDRAEEHWLRAEAELTDELDARLRPAG